MSSSAGLFQVVTYATDLLSGNPAFILLDTGDATDEALATMCKVLRTDVVGVIDSRAGNDPVLRFFTADGSHPGAGHVTLAAADVAINNLHLGKKVEGLESVTFHLLNGERRVARAIGERIEINFPVMAASRVDRIADMENALGKRPMETWISPFGYVGYFRDASAIAEMEPNMVGVAAFDRPALIATAPGGDTSDIVIRVFAPRVGLPEDPVCGTAHRIIIPYWAERLGKSKIHSRHLSPRGGDLWCEVSGDEIIIAGKSRTIMSGIVELPG